MRFFNGCVDYIFCAVSTCGTIRGYSECIKEYRYNCKLIAVDAIGSVIFGDTVKKRLIPGHGAAILPPLFQESLVDDFLQVSDWDCVSAIMKYKDKIPAGSNCVLIVHDKGIPAAVLHT